MEEKSEQLLEQGHQIISSFLGEWREKLDSYIHGDKQQEILLDHAISFGLSRDRETRKQLQERFGSARSNKSKAKTGLNKSLNRFSRDCGIEPPIQLYFLASGIHKRITHFACCDNEGEVKSSLYIRLTELKNVLSRASQRLAEKKKQEDFPKVHEKIEPIIRGIIERQAKKHLSEKLGFRDDNYDDNGYLPLGLECGIVSGKETKVDLGALTKLYNSSPTY